MASNNNVGANKSAGRNCDDIHFDLAPTTGTDTFGGNTGTAYDVAALKAIILARGATYESDASAFALVDDVVEIEVDLKPIDGEGFNEGDPTQPVVATTSDASYANNGSATNIDPSGGRQDGQDSTNQNVPTSVDSLFVCNGSVLTVHITFCKDASPAKPVLP